MFLEKVTWLPSRRARAFHQEVGRALIHSGDIWHCVRPIMKGARWNLVIWALRDDQSWKEEFYPKLEAELDQP